jgi:hypothetical protein
VIWLYRAEPRVWRPATAALAALVAAQAIFCIWTFPANQATDNWTSQPQNWEILRQQWEYRFSTPGHDRSHCCGTAPLIMLAIDRARERGRGERVP